jgi:two-component system, chemotaxis family, protein-glutamate methylesterase/glutaminase
MDQIDRLIVIGVSAGGLRALQKIFTTLSRNFKIPILINQHLPRDRPSSLATILQAWSHLVVKEADDKERIFSGTVYIAPPAYHLLVERNHTLSLSMDDPENHARPSADVLFESAADAFGKQLIGIVLTGASEDGARGLLQIKNRGGTIMVQSPFEAEAQTMPLAAIRLTQTQNILTLEEIVERLNRLEG